MAGKDGKARVSGTSIVIIYIANESLRFQIQILLYFLKLSLPGPADLPEPSPKKRKRARKEVPAESLEDCLEGFMDKISMWQLIDSLERDVKPVNTGSNDAQRDWMQSFFEEIVNPQ